MGAARMSGAAGMCFSSMKAAWPDAPFDWTVCVIGAVGNVIFTRVSVHADRESASWRKRESGLESEYVRHILQK